MGKTKGKNELNPKQKIFVEHYATNFNAVKAAEFAGYTPKSAKVRAFEFIKSEKIQRALQERLQLTIKKAKLSPEFVLKGLREIFERCMQFKEATDRDGKKLGYFKFEPNPALKALELIGRNYDMFSPNVVVNLNVEIDKQLAAARKRAASLIAVKQEIKDVTKETKDLKAESRKKDGLNSPTIQKVHPGLI